MLAVVKSGNVKCVHLGNSFYFFYFFLFFLTFLIFYSNLFNICFFIFCFIIIHHHRTTLQAECIFHETLHNFKNLPKTTKIPCPICNKSFRKASLRCHLHHHTNERIYQCPLCPTSFTRKHNVKAHIDKVHGTKEKEKNVGENVDKKFICSICGKPFKMR